MLGFHPDKSWWLLFWFSSLFALRAGDAFAFGDEGHTLSCRIAWQSLAPDTRVWLKSILDSRRRSAFEKACTWADGPGRAHAAYAWLRPLHYVGVPLGAESADPVDHCAPAGCVLRALPRFHQVLQDEEASVGDRQLALRMLVHLIADLHLPVHVAHADQRGGTRTKVRIEATGPSSRSAPELETAASDVGTHEVLSSMLWNEHMLWDSGFLVAWMIDDDRLEKFLRSIPVSHAAQTMDEEQVASWANESLRLAQQKELFVVDSDTPLTSTQAQNATARMLERLQQAGARIAETLNALALAKSAQQDPRARKAHHGPTLASPNAPERENVRP